MTAFLVWVFLLFSAVWAKSLSQTNVITADEIERLYADPTIPKSDLKIMRWIPEMVNSSRMQTPRFDFEYMMGEFMSVGEPPEKYLLALETAVPDMFLFHDSWKGDGPKRYSEVRSSTSRPVSKAFRSRSGDVACYGKTFEDKIKAGGSLSPFRQQFGAVTDMKFDGAFPKDGVFGLGWIPGRRLRSDSTPVLNLMESQRLKTPMQYTLAVRTGDAGVVFYGHKFHAKSLPARSVAGAPAIEVAGFTVGDYSDSIKNWGFVDSGWAVIGLPSSQYRIFAKNLKFQFDPKLGHNVVDCGEKAKIPPPMNFTIGNEEYEVTADEYLIDVKNDKCVVAVLQSVDSYYHFGLPFLRTVGLVVDLKRNTIGLPKVIHN